MVLFTVGTAGCGGHSTHGATTRGTPSVAVGGDDSHACALISGGDIYCWGDNHAAELGHRLPRGQHRSDKPLKTERVSKAISLSAGDGFTCAALPGGSVECWGSNASGTLGRGRISKYGYFVSGLYSSPAAVRGVRRATAVSGTLNHVCALLSDDRVMCWGDNEYGELGDGRSRHKTWVIGPSDIRIDLSLRPVAVKGIRTATQISAGNGETCAVLESGRVKCWGFVGTDGAPDHHGDIESTTPVEVKGIRNARQVSVGLDWGFACAVIGGGSVKCWGYGAPATVRGVAGAIQVSAGYEKACAVVRSGAVDCWNQDSARMGRAAPVKGVSDTAQVSLGSTDSCALSSDGTVWCWQAGPLELGPGGLGSTARSKVPTEVSGLP